MIIGFFAISITSLGLSVVKFAKSSSVKFSTLSITFWKVAEAFFKSKRLLNS